MSSAIVCIRLSCSHAITALPRVLNSTLPASSPCGLSRITAVQMPEQSDCRLRDIAARQKLAIDAAKAIINDHKCGIASFAPGTEDSTLWLRTKLCESEPSLVSETMS